MTDAVHIQLLSDIVANKIAAGEVVERPRSVLKELVENSIDAGASQVDVEITSGGKKLLAVTDNGRGMNRDDAMLCIERHATSKIRDVDDIERIGTLGFRGEALAAISSVSRFKLKTCASGEVAGTEVAISGGKLQDVRDAGGPSGTRIEVRDLFFNVPARRKFLRTEQTELSHVRQHFIVQALARPDIGMSLTVDGREVYRLTPSTDLADRLAEVFGNSYVQKLRNVDFRQAGVHVTGYVGLPSASRSDRNEQFIFVNSRAASAPVIGYSIGQGYHTLLPAKRHPLVFLAIATDPALVDVNVHPAKKEVRFRRSSDIRDALIGAIRQALGASGAGPSPTSALGSLAEPGPVIQVQVSIPDLPETRSFRYPSIPMIPDPGADTTAAQPASTPPSPDSPASSVATTPWSWCRVLGQIGGLYVLLETEDGFVTMDPHAAHERVLFERFTADVTAGSVESQGLLAPETIELMPQDARLVRKNIDLFKRMGFGISEFGGDTFVIDALPSYFAGTAPDRLLTDIATGLERAGGRGGGAAMREESIAQAACKAAVKARDRMTLEEIEKLVVDLANAQMPYTCPHGRPTLIYTSFKDLNKKFGRGG